MSSGRAVVSSATLSRRADAMACGPSSASVRASRSSPNSSRPTLASVTPSVWKQTCDQPGTDTMVWRVPVRIPAPIGGDEQAVMAAIGSEPSTIGGG